MATQKELFVIDLLEVAQNAAKQVMDKVSVIDSSYFDNGYDGGGSDPIVDTPDLDNFNGITAAEIASVITAFQQLNNFFQNAAVTQGDYSVTLNAVRTASLS
jgi:hypothetical protein